MVQHEMENITDIHDPRVYPQSTWCNYIWPNLPGLPPLCLHTANDQILEAGTPWEWGYVDSFSGLSDYKHKLAYHDGRIAGCETLHLPSSPESEKPGVVSPRVLCRLFRFPVVTLLGKYHRVCRCNRPVWVFTCDPHICHLEVSCYLQTTSCFWMLQQGCAATDLLSLKIICVLQLVS